MTLKTETVLDQLVAGVAEDLAADRAARPEAEVCAQAADAPPARGLAAALRRPSVGRSRLPAVAKPALAGEGRSDGEGRPAADAAPGEGRLRVLAEVKRASPAAGMIADIFDPAGIAARYERGGAAAVSVLTERRRFLGSMDHLRAVRAAVGLPVLRKEFIFDPYQIHEARAGGADGILLIAAILETARLADLRAQAEEMGMDALVEVYAEEELGRALEAGARILGVNNRDLKTFEVDAGRTLRIFSKIPPARREGLVLVSESGLAGWADAAPLAAAGVDAVLVGEALMRAPSPEGLIKELRGLG